MSSAWRVCLVGAWLVVQVAGTVLPMFGTPEWLPRTIVVLLAIGFVPALIFSWIFELTPEGLKRDAEVPLEQSIAPQTGRRMDRMIIVVMALALGYFAFDKFVLTPRREALVAGAAPSESKSIISAKSIAVLPFDNLSRDPDNAYFCEGVQDEILTRLAKVADLKVISRTSTQHFKSTPDNLPQIAKQLGVAHIVEGSVQKANNQVRVNVQLINASNDAHLWAETYDRKLLDTFQVESDIAEKIASKLEAKLTGKEKAAINARGTDNPQAYETYLRAIALNNSQSDADSARMRDLLREAVQLDPHFAQAWAWLAARESIRYFFPEENPAQKERAHSAADTALRLAPIRPTHRARWVCIFTTSRKITTKHCAGSIARGLSHRTTRSSSARPRW